MAVIVYLDSQDYSKLSNETLGSTALSGVKRRLLYFSTDGRVNFISSSVLVTEISPFEKLSVQHARRRAELLSQLCHRTTFRSIDFLLRSEFLSYGKNSPCRESLMSSNGDWFPDIGDIIDGIDLDIDFKAIAKENANPGSNRHERRKAIKGLIRKGKVREAILPQFLAIAATSAMDDLKTKYPMKDENLLLDLLHTLSTQLHGLKM